MACSAICDAGAYGALNPDPDTDTDSDNPDSDPEPDPVGNDTYIERKRKICSFTTIPSVVALANAGIQ